MTDIVSLQSIPISRRRHRNRPAIDRIGDCASDGGGKLPSAHDIVILSVRRLFPRQSDRRRRNRRSVDKFDFAGGAAPIEQDASATRLLQAQSHGFGRIPANDAVARPHPVGVIPFPRRKSESANDKSPDSCITLVFAVDSAGDCRPQQAVIIRAFDRAPFQNGLHQILIAQFRRVIDIRYGEIRNAVWRLRQRRRPRQAHAHGVGAIAATIIRVARFHLVIVNAVLRTVVSMYANLLGTTKRRLRQLRISAHCAGLTTPPPCAFVT